MNLTQKERDKFILYLKSNADDFDKIIEQMNKIKVPEVLIKRNTLRSAAYRIVAQDLENTESFTIDT